MQYSGSSPCGKPPRRLILGAAAALGLLTALTPHMPTVLAAGPAIVIVPMDDWLAPAAAAGAASIDRSGLVDEFLTTEADRPLIDLVDQVGMHTVPLAVVDDERRLLGVVPRAALLASLAVPGRS